jgi:spermidine/putrescine transport system permease protein
VVTPDIIFAAALVVAFGLLRSVSTLFNPGLLTMIIGHVTFQIAFVAIVVHSRLALLGRTLDEAARDLYAARAQLLRRVTLPLLAPGIVAGAMLAFILSLEDFVISFFTAGPESTTLPIFIYSSVRRGVTPEIHALSTIVFLVTVVLVIGWEALNRFRRG